MSAVMPSISSCTGPYSAQIAADRVPAEDDAPSPYGAPALAGARLDACGAAGAEVLETPSPQLRSMWANIEYDSATSPSSTAASTASAHTSPCASAQSRGMHRMQQPAHRFLRARRGREGVSATGAAGARARGGRGGARQPPPTRCQRVEEAQFPRRHVASSSGKRVGCAHVVLQTLDPPQHRRKQPLLQPLQVRHMPAGSLARSNLVHVSI